MIGGQLADQRRAIRWRRSAAALTAILKLFMGNGDLQRRQSSTPPECDVGGTLFLSLLKPAGDNSEDRVHGEPFLLKNGVLDTRVGFSKHDQGNVYSAAISITRTAEASPIRSPRRRKPPTSAPSMRPIDITGTLKHPNARAGALGAFATRLGVTAALLLFRHGLLATGSGSVSARTTIAARWSPPRSSSKPLTPQTAGPTTGTPNAPAMLPSVAARRNPGPAANDALPQQAQAPIATPEPATAAAESRARHRARHPDAGGGSRSVRIPATKQRDGTIDVGSIGRGKEAALAADLVHASSEFKHASVCAFEEEERVQIADTIDLHHQIADR